MTEMTVKSLISAHIPARPYYMPQITLSSGPQLLRMLHGSEEPLRALGITTSPEGNVLTSMTLPEVNRAMMSVRMSMALLDEYTPDEFTPDTNHLMVKSSFPSHTEATVHRTVEYLNAMSEATGDRSQLFDVWGTVPLIILFLIKGLFEEDQALTR